MSGAAATLREGLRRYRSDSMLLDGRDFDEARHDGYDQALDSLVVAVEGLMDVAELAMPDSYFTTDSRVVAARVAIAGESS